MHDVEVWNRINVVEEDGVEVEFQETRHVEIRSHGDIQDLVCLQFRDKVIAVYAKDLLAAIQNATNTG